MEARPELPIAKRSRSQRRVPLARRFVTRSAIALALLSVVVIWVIFGSERTFGDIETSTSQLAAASSQPARVHRILEFANQQEQAVIDGDVRIATERTSRIRQEAAAMRQVQSGLVDGDDQLGLPPAAISPQLEELYAGSGRLVERVHEYALTAVALTEIDDPLGNEEWSVLRAVLAEAEEQLIEDLEQAVSIYSAEVEASITQRRDINVLIILTAIGIGLIVVLALFRPMARMIQRETTQLEVAERQQRENSERQSFRNDLARAFEVCEDEGEVIHAMSRAMGEVVAEHPAELLMMAGDDSRLRVSIVHPDAGSPDCPVDNAESCAALRAGQAMVYESSRMLNVCPKLPQHRRGPCSAVCVPLVFNGHAMGVLHAVGPENGGITHMATERLKVLGTEGASRIGTIRITKATERLARVDVLTDLDNRRTLIERVNELIADGDPFSLAIADLDHFKDLNDTYGHETGDRALQLFSSCLRSTLRPEDIVARYGGEEFVVVLPRTSITRAVTAIERAQVTLAEMITEHNCPPFTASWGLTASDTASTFEEALRIADLALYEAKAEGRNCLVVDGDAAARHAQTHAHAHAESDTEPNAGGNPGTGTETEAGSQARPDAGSNAGSQARLDAGSDAGSESPTTTEPMPTPGPAATAAPGPAAGPAPTPTPAPNTD